MKNPGGGGGGGGIGKLVIASGTPGGIGGSGGGNHVGAFWISGFCSGGLVGSPSTIHKQKIFFFENLAVSPSFPGGGPSGIWISSSLVISSVPGGSPDGRNASSSSASSEYFALGIHRNRTFRVSFAIHLAR
jgi:hypothetical protein